MKRIKQLEAELSEQEMVLGVFEGCMSTPQLNEAKRQAIHKLNDPPRTRLTRTQLEFKIKELNGIIQKLKQARTPVPAPGSGPQEFFPPPPNGSGLLAD